MNNVHFDFSGKVVLITGCAGHIGSAVCQKFLNAGAVVIGMDINSETKHMKTTVGAFEFLQVDLEDNSDIVKSCAYLAKKYRQLDVVINNAAFVGTSSLSGWGVPFEQQTIETWRRAVDVNLTSVFSICQQTYGMLKNSKSASIINIGSIYANLGPDWNLYEGTSMSNPAAYSASKGGVVQLTRWLATTLKPNIRVNTISPGGIYRGQPESFVKKFVERTPLGRMATEEDIIGTILFLSSDLSAYITGQNINVDGGWSTW